MVRPRPTTTERGYGWEHQQARAEALRTMAPGAACPFCSGEMVRGMALDYDHYPPLALGGGGVRRLAHASCNRRAGQAIATQLRRIRSRPVTRATNSRAW